MNVAVKMKSEEKNQESKESFLERHIGPRSSEFSSMLSVLGEKNLSEFISKVIPSKIRSKAALQLKDFPENQTEVEVISRLEKMASRNQQYKSYIGMGYYDCVTPPVIQRNILENPGWYTQYTPYQPEISQGRLEALLNYQTMVAELTGLPISNASLLDEATAAAEAMVLCHSQAPDERAGFFVASDCHPQTIAVVQTRAEGLGIKVLVAESSKFDFSTGYFGALLQYPTTFGEISDYSKFIAKAHENQILVALATDLLALTLLTPPGELGADVAVGSAQRFGVPLGYGGPHAAFFATKDEFKRGMAGRLIGVSKDSNGNPAMRLALQTREQHIRREKATSNICTAQVLLAIMASMYAVYHGPQGLKRIARRVNTLTNLLAHNLKLNGFKLSHAQFFDTIKVELETELMGQIINRAVAKTVNLRVTDDSALAVSLDETTTADDVETLLQIFCGKEVKLAEIEADSIPAALKRKSAFLKQPVFNSYFSETEFLRYLKRLESKDLSLAVAMIPLGSCTMKLNATSEMLPVTWKGIGAIHPFAPRDQVPGYGVLFDELETALAEITGFSAVSLQPNSGAQGEYAGLLAIRSYLKSIGQAHREVCLIPKSAHGTNPASAVMAGLKVVVVECDSSGNIDFADLKAKAEANKEKLACLMATYPSTHGVFEEGIKEICEVIHAAGGQVYMDGANLNAMVGLVRPYDIGADLCHINLHKTFCIPHGGGGPGMGPIAVRSHLAPFLPSHPVVGTGNLKGVGPVSAAPWGSASILTIPWVYIALMGGSGLTTATEVAILSANYIAKRLEAHYPVLYRGANGYIAHECILDLRPIEKNSGVKVEDVAKRLMDYGFHAPTVSFPVAGTLMVEPTESESKQELDRFCDAMIMIREEIREIEAGKIDKENNPLKNAPHTAQVVSSSEWNRPYSREKAAYPAPWLVHFKFWPACGRIDAAYGDKNLVCTCPDISSYT